MGNDTKTNVDLTAKAEAKVNILPSKDGSDVFLKRIGFGIAALCVLGGVAGVITAAFPNGIFG